MPAPKDPKKREEWIKKKSASMKRRYDDPNERVKQSERMKEITNRPEMREKNSAAQKIAQNRPEVKAKKSVSLKMALNQPGVQKKRVETRRNSGKPWFSEEAKVIMSVSAKKSVPARIARNRPEVKKKKSVAKMGDKNSNKRPEVRAKKSVSMKKRWKDPKFKEEQLRAIFRGCQLLPNKPEKFLDELLQELFPNQWKYVGDGGRWLGGKNPDFININGQKKIIEHFGDYYHGEKVIGISSKQHEQERIDLFARFGYQTLIIWEHEIENIVVLKKKILEFNNAK